MTSELIDVNAVGSEPSVLYHYTDADGLRGIVTSGELWATDAFYLNDASELRYVFQLVVEELDQIERSDSPSPDTVSEVAKMVRLAADIALETIHDDIPFFVACFCEKKDLLSQWRGYAKSVGGFSIGFKRRELEAVDEQRDFGRCEFEKVSYDVYSQRAQLREQLREAIKRYELTGESERDRLSLWQSVMGGYFGEVGFNAVLYKSSGFVEESEWRIVVRARAVELATRSLVHFRTGPMGLIPYVGIDVCGADSRRPLIGEIVVGPTPHPELAERSVRMLLASVGFEDDEVTISHSKIPLRT